MTDEQMQSHPGAHRFGWWMRIAMTVGVVAASAFGMLGYFAWALPDVGPAQPIAFSHRFHVTERNLSCILCHPGVINGARAEIPPVETCMLCHEHIIIHHPQIEKLRAIYAAGDPISWVRVNEVPDTVHFNHSVHFRAGFDCGQCHGDVAQMDRVDQPVLMNMGFCTQCHRDNNFSVDCYICHR